MRVGDTERYGEMKDTESRVSSPTRHGGCGVRAARMRAGGDGRGVSRAAFARRREGRRMAGCQGRRLLGGGSLCASMPASVSRLSRPRLMGIVRDEGKALCIPSSPVSLLGILCILHARRASHEHQSPGLSVSPTCSRTHERPSRRASHSSGRPVRAPAPDPRIQVSRLAPPTVWRICFAHTRFAPVAAL